MLVRNSFVTITWHTPNTHALRPTKRMSRSLCVPCATVLSLLGEANNPIFLLVHTLTTTATLIQPKPGEKSSPTGVPQRAARQRKWFQLTAPNACSIFAWSTGTLLITVVRGELLDWEEKQRMPLLPDLEDPVGHSLTRTRQASHQTNDSAVSQQTFKAIWVKTKPWLGRWPHLCNKIQAHLAALLAIIHIWVLKKLLIWHWLKPFLNLNGCIRISRGLRLLVDRGTNVSYPSNAVKNDLSRLRKYLAPHSWEERIGLPCSPVNFHSTIIFFLCVWGLVNFFSSFLVAL